MSHELAGVVRDREGALWISADQPMPPQRWRRTSAVRLDQTGMRQQIEIEGWPLLADQAGNVWLGGNRYRSDPPDSLWLWCRGRIVQKLQIPAKAEKDPMFSDRPGSVYVWTAAGMIHLTADAPDYASYRVAAVYPVREVRGTIHGVAYSSYGCLAAVTFTDEPRRRYHIFLLEVPKE